MFRMKWIRCPFFGATLRDRFVLIIVFISTLVSQAFTEHELYFPYVFCLFGLQNATFVDCVNACAYVVFAPLCNKSYACSHFRSRFK